MKRTRRHHSREFKQEAVALMVKPGDCCPAAGRSLGVSGVLLGGEGRTETHKAEAFPGQGKRST